MASNKLFSSKIGMIAATVGSAVGLGNIWRFPAEVHDGGGAAFLMIYVVCVVVLGIPVMLSEFALGRAGRSDAVGAMLRVGASKRWSLVGGWATLASYLILCFYMVVAGWTFEYLVESATGGLFDFDKGTVDQAAGLNGAFTEKMETFISGSWNPLINTFVMIMINIVVLIGGVRKGIERLSNIVMPLLFIILLVFVGVSLSLPRAWEGVEFFLRPDFSKVTPSTVISALGQAFFSLSLGMGILITYAGYYPRGTKLMRTAVTVSALDLLVAVMMGLIIFPAITSFGLTGESVRGETLVFVSLPEVFSQLPASQLWSVLFFLLLTIAALTSTISIAEVSVAFISDRFKIKRWKSVLIVLCPLFLFSAVCSLSMGPLSDVTIMGQTIFNLLNNLATDVMLPVGSIFLCVYMGWIAPRNLFMDQLTNGGKLHSAVYPLVVNIVRFIAPVLIAMVLLSPLF